MGSKFSRANVIQDWQGRLHASAQAMHSVDSDLAFLAEQSAQDMQHLIASRPTHSDWAKQEGRTGRVDSQKMVDAVEFRRNPHASRLVFSWEFGWLDTFMKYFRYQEEGFNHIYAGPIEPMFALRDASMEARDRLTLLGTQIFEKAARLIKGH